MKTGNGRTLTALAILAAILVAFGGCENFMSKDKSFKESIEKEVKVANAKEFKILVLGITGQATTSPTGKTTQKVDVPFSVLVQPSEAYGFIEWQAFSTTDTAQELPLDATVITFSDPKAMTTDVTVHVARSDILIQPKTDKRPKLTSTSPGNGKDKVFLNVPIRLYFSKPMNPASFLFEDGSDKQGSGKTIAFKNITMTRQRGTTEPESCAYMYSPPKLDKTGKVLTITPIMDQEGGYTVTIECSLLVTDTFGITMSESSSFSFVYSGLKDNNPPTVNVEYITGPNGTWTTDAANPGHYPVAAGSTITLGLNVADGTADAPESQLSAIYILETRLRTDMDVPDGTAGTMITVDAYDNGKYTIPYIVQTSGDGQIQLSIWAKDTTDNVGDKAPFKYVYYRDVTPPAVGNIAVTNLPPSSVDNYYNIAAHSVNLSEAGVDVGESGYASGIVKAQIQLMGTNGLHVESAWFDGTLTGLEIPTLFPDGAVFVKYRLMDGIGNVSGYMDAVTVKKDTTTPSGTISVVGATPVGSVTYLKPDPDPLKTVSVNLAAISDGGSGFAEYKIAHSTTRHDYSTSEGFMPYDTNRAYSTSFVVNDNANHYFYVWFRDKAGNETPAGSPMETIIAADKTPPTIDNFTVTRSVSDTSRYSNTITWYFSVTASDLASGVKDFTFGPSNSISGVNRVSAGNSVTYTGTLTYNPLSQGEIPLTVTVTDYIGNETLATSLAAAKKVYYDTGNPTGLSAKFHPNDAVTNNKTTIGDISYYYSGSTLFTNKKDGHTLTVSLTDLISDAASYDVTGSGIESASSVTRRPFDSTSPGHSPGSVKTGTHVINLSSGEGLKYISIYGRDFAENMASLVPDKMITLDMTPPTFVMRLTDLDVTSTWFPKTSFPDAASAQSIYGTETTAYKNMNYFEFAVSSINDNASGFATGDYPWKLYRYINGIHDDETGGQDVTVSSGTFNSLSGSGSFANITIPTVMAGGAPQPSSGRYYVSLKLKDNLGNENVEQRIGYFYDERAPYVAATRALKEGGTVLPYIGGKYWIDNTNLYIQARATDTLNDISNTRHDPYGSGISTVYLDYDPNGGADGYSRYTYTSSSYSTFAEGGSIVFDPGNASTWFDIGYRSGSSVYKSLGTVSGTMTERNFRVLFLDRMGNGTDGTNATFTVAKDVEGPTIGAANTFISGYDSTVHYLNPLSTSMGETSITPIFNDAGSGVRAWIMKSAASEADVDNVDDAPSYSDVPNLASDSGADITAYNTAWAGYQTASTWQKGPTSEFGTFTAPAQTAPFHDVSAFPDNAIRYVRFYAIDFLGNVSEESLYAGQKFRMDSSAPTVSSFTINDDAEATNNASRNVTLKVTVLDSGSGVKQLVFTNTESLGVGSTLTGSKGIAYEVSRTGTTITFRPDTVNRNPGGSGAETFTLTATLPTGENSKSISVQAIDAVGNASTTITKSIVWDVTAPVVGTMSIKGLSGKFVSENIIDLVIPFTEAATGSGVRTIVLGGIIEGLQSDATITVGTGPGTTTITGWEYASGTKTITLPSGIKDTSSPITLNKVTLPVSFDGATITAQLSDTAANVSVAGQMTGLTRDTTEPVSVTMVLNANAEWTTSDAVIATITATENGSGIEKFAFSGLDATNATVTSTYGTALVKDTAKSDATTLVLKTVYPKQAGAITFTVSGLELTNTQGEHTASVVVYDLAGNDSATASDTIKLDSMKPPAPTVTHTCVAGEYYRTDNQTYYTQAIPNISFVADATDAGSASTRSGVTGYRYGSTAVFSDSSAYTGQNLAAGTYNFWSVDAAGNNSDPSYTTIKLARDNTLPAAPSISSVQGTGTGIGTTTYLKTGVYYTSLASIDITLAAGSDTQSGWDRFTCTGGTGMPSVSGNVITIVPETTETTYTITSYDKIGNPNPVSTLKICKDATDPDVPSISSITGTKYDVDVSSPTFSYYTKGNSLVFIMNTGSDPAGGAGFREFICTGATVDVSEITIPVTNDSATFTVYAYDMVNNDSSITITVRKDYTAPNAPSVSSVANKAPDTGTIFTKTASPPEYMTKNETIVLTMTSGSDKGPGLESGFASFTCATASSVSGTTIELPVTATSVKHTIFATDNVGNSTPLEVTVQRDTQAPPAPSISGTDNPGNAAAPYASDSIGPDFVYYTNDTQIDFTFDEVTDNGCSGFDAFTCTPAPTAINQTTRVIRLPAATASATYTISSVDKIGLTSSITITTVKDVTDPGDPVISTTTVPANFSNGNNPIQTVYGNPCTYYTNDTAIKFTMNAGSDDGGSLFSHFACVSTNGGAAATVSGSLITIPAETTSRSYTVTAFDHAGNDSATLTINVIRDTSAPSCSTITASGNFFFSGTDSGDTGGDATIYYSATGTTTLVTSDAFKVAGTIATVDTGSLPTSITVTDLLGNSRVITLSPSVSDATCPTIAVDDLTPSNNDVWDFTVTDGGNPLPPYVNGETKYVCYYRADALGSWVWAGTDGWSTTYTKSSQACTLYFDKDQVYGKRNDTGALFNLPTISGTDYFAIKATDGVGHITYLFLSREWKDSAVLLKVLGSSTVARRGFVPDSPGEIGSSNEVDFQYPVKNAWSATGDSLIDWKSGQAPSKPMRQNAVATVPAGRGAKLNVSSRKAGKSAQATKPALAVDVESFHKLAVAETSAPNAGAPATSSTSTASFGTNATTIGTELLPDSVVEARVSVIAPLAEKFMAVRGIRFALDPKLDARNRLIALVRAGAGGVRSQGDRSQETPQPADIGGIGVAQPVAGILPKKNGKKG